MKAEKARGPSGVTFDIFKLCGEDSVKRLKNKANGLFNSKKCHKAEE